MKMLMPRLFAAGGTSRFPRYPLHRSASRTGRIAAGAMP